MSNTREVAIFVKRAELDAHLANGGAVLEFLLGQIVDLEERLARAEAGLKNLPRRLGNGNL